MNKRHLVLEYKKRGKSQTEISRLLKISRCGVQLIIKKHKQGYSLQDKPKLGRPTSLSKSEKRKIVMESNKFPFKTAKEGYRDSGIHTNVSVDTVKRTLRQNNLFGRTAANKPSLTKVNKAKRLQWCKEKIGWTIEDSRKVIFSDEAKIELTSHSGEKVRLPKGMRHNSRYVKGTKKFSPYLMLWGAIRDDGQRTLLRCLSTADSQEYQRLLKNAIPKIYNSRKLLQQDGATCHRSASTKRFLEEKRIRILENWPAQSPDLNLIEIVWSILKKDINKKTYNDLGHLEESVMEAWQNILSTIVTKLYESMPKRIRAVVRARGGHTRY